MSDLNSRIREDLSRKVRDLIQPVLEREINLAARMLPIDEVALLAVQVAAGVSSGMMLIPAQFTNVAGDRAVVYDLMVEELVRRLREHRGDLLAELAAKEAAVRKRGRL